MSNLENLINYNLPKCFKALSNPTRFKVYIEILEEACDCNLDEDGYVWGNCVTGIATKLNLGQPTVSNHVKELINCGLIYTQKKGKNTYLFGDESIAQSFQNFAKFMEMEINGHD